jgi:hypothetical protein
MIFFPLPHCARQTAKARELAFSRSLEEIRELVNHLNLIHNPTAHFFLQSTIVLGRKAQLCETIRLPNN